jgi:hypothetical protein
MSKIVLGTPTPHWAQRVGDFLGNLGAQQRRQREIEEQQKQQAMQQEIERARQYVKNAADPNAALQQVPEALRPFVTYETYRDPLTEQKRKIEAARQGEVLGLYGQSQQPQSQPQAPVREPFDFRQESEFSNWYAGHAKQLGLNPNPDDPQHRYDYRAAHRSGAEPQLDPQSGEMHWPSQFKAPDHPNRYVNGVDTISGTKTLEFVPGRDGAPGLDGAAPIAPSTGPGQMQNLGNGGGGSVAEQIMNRILRIGDALGDEKMKQAAELVMMSGLPDSEEMDALRIRLKTLVDAPTRYDQDSTTERTQMQQTGANHRTQVTANASRDVANINQGGATFRHTTPSADAKLKQAPRQQAKIIEDTPGYKKQEAFLSGLHDQESKLLQERAGSQEMLKRFPGAVSEKQKLQRTEGILAMLRSQIEQKKKERDATVTKLKAGGWMLREEYEAAKLRAPAGDGSPAPLSDDMRAAIRALDPSITEAELNDILTGGGFDE